MPTNPIPADSLPLKRSKAPARGKMPSKAQAALLRQLEGAGRYGAKEFNAGKYFGIWREGHKIGHAFPRGEVTAESCQRLGYLEATIAYPYPEQFKNLTRREFRLTPAGREVLKHMDVK